MATIVLDNRAVRDLLDLPGVIRGVEQAFCDWALGRATMPPKAYITVGCGDFRAMPASIPGVAGVKWVNVHPDNPARGLPTVMAVWVHSDPETGYPLAVMDATEITASRTAAAAAIASRHLARPDSHVLGIIGAGRQAYTQVEAHAHLFRLSEVRVYDRSGAAAGRLARAFPALNPRVVSLEEAAAADIVCTLTPSRRPFLKREMVGPGTHINAVGADAEGKQELEPALLNGAMVVVDDIRQATAAGEINVPVSRGLFSPESVYGTLGEIVAGLKPGRQDPQIITIFDSTGVAIQDAAVAKLVYERALARGDYLSVDLVGYSRPAGGK